MGDINTEFTPFLVSDRQASLRIISGMDVSKLKGKIGIMSHANTSNNFKHAFSKYPCLNKSFCEVVQKPCEHDMEIKNCPAGMVLKKRTIKISDSGVFTKNGCMFADYEKLFEEYEKMGVNYGIMIDHLRDFDATIKSAKEGMIAYAKKNRNFKLIGVAQGDTIDRYLECYKKLKAMGYEYIAVGGLLQRIKNTVRYTKVENEEFLFEVLRKIREYDPDGWLFALGCYSKTRRVEFTRLGIFGSDYKGWIFHYTKRYKSQKRAQADRFLQVRTFLEDNVFGFSKLLIISCSQRKITTKKALPAIYVYDGPFYKLLRKYIASFENNDGLDIFILSAKYGLINPLKQIRSYEFKMNPERAEKLNKIVLRNLQKIFKKKAYSEMFINLGSDYLKAIDGSKDLIRKVSPGTQIAFAYGRIGKRMKQMREWIVSDRPRFSELNLCSLK